MQRSDPHSPSSLIPADYSFLFGYAHPSSVDGWPIPGFNMALLISTRTGKPTTYMGYGGIEHAEPLTQRVVTEPFGDVHTHPILFSSIHKNGPCDICGAWHIEGSVFLHHPSGEAIAIGWQCADKLELDYDESERAKIKGDRKAARASVIAKAKKRAHLREFVMGATDQLLFSLKLDHHITRSIRAQVLRGRTLTQRQIDLVLKLYADDAKVEARVAAPSREERIVVEGTVVGLKVHESSFSSSLKMTVRVTEPNGVWLCWGTVPAGLDGPLRGCVVRFTARFTVSPTDESFSFFRRPTKASIVKLGPEGVVELDRLWETVREVREEGANKGTWFEDLLAKTERLELLR